MSREGSYNFKKLYKSGLFENESIALKFIIESDLLRNGCYCSDDCDGILEIVKNSKYKYGLALQCPTCGLCKSIFDGSFFTRSKLKIHKVLEIIYHWSLMKGVSETAFEVGVTEPTVTNFYQALRDACIDWIEIHKNENKIGGSNTTVEVDETLMVKRKSNAGRILSQIWIVGGICRETGKCFAKRVENRNADTLTEVILDHVKPETTIHTDMWRGYIRLRQTDQAYIHRTVDHSKNFVDPETGVHTQNIERLWRELKDVLKRYRGIPKEEVDSHVAEFLWRRNKGVKRENAFIETIHMLQDVEFE